MRMGNESLLCQEWEKVKAWEAWELGKKKREAKVPISFLFFPLLSLSSEKLGKGLLIVFPIPKEENAVQEG